MAIRKFFTWKFCLLLSVVIGHSCIAFQILKHANARLARFNYYAHFGRFQECLLSLRGAAEFSKNVKTFFLIGVIFNDFAKEEGKIFRYTRISLIYEIHPLCVSHKLRSLQACSAFPNILSGNVSSRGPRDK